MILGLDIGGANLKAANSQGAARTLPFALWKEPGRLPVLLGELIDSMPPADVLAVTMTGELCDCFASQTEGVLAILQAVESSAQQRKVLVWTKRGSFVDLHQARRQTADVAAANWLALASYAAKLTHDEAGMLLDIGSTTTDIIPLWLGTAQPKSFTDPDRLQSMELVYCGARRTPLCALLGLSAAAEFFASTLDVGLILHLIPENVNDRDTADGRPATRAAAHARLAHMLCGDAESVNIAQVQLLAQRALQVQVNHLARAVEHVAANMIQPAKIVVLAGSGEFLARKVLEAVKSPPAAMISLAQEWGPELSQAACAFAVARLAEAHG